MSSRRLVRILLVSLAANAALAQRAPDVYLVTIDTLRADHVGAYGYAAAQTPTLDALARDGVRFEQAFTASPITNTSHASILTGLLPSAHGVTDFGTPLAASKVSVAARLRAAGYRTGAFVGSIILDSHSLARGFDQGFDTYDGFSAAAADKTRKTEAGARPAAHAGLPVIRGVIAARNGAGAGAAPANGAAEGRAKQSRYGRVERRAADVLARAQQWITAAKFGRARPRPIFAWVHLYDPHDPYDPPAPFAEKFAGRNKDGMYDGEIAYTDHALGEFVKFLKARGLYDNAVIIVVGDHGEGLGEHGEDTHGIFLYDATLHVPLLLKLPRQAMRGTVVTAQARTIDIAPTVVELAGFSEKAAVSKTEASAKMDGVSLHLLWKKGASAERVALGEADYPLRFGWAPLRSVRAEGFKYIEAPRPELYDLRADAGETKNVYQPWADEVKRLRQILADANLPALGTPGKNDAQKSGAVSAETVAELKALGYFGNEPGSTTAREPSLLPDPKDKIEQQNALHRAQLADEDGDAEGARAILKKVIAADPAAESAMVQLGRIELAQHDHRAAAAAFAAALKLRPADSAVAYSLGQSLFRLGDHAGARAALEQSLQVDPAQYDARMMLGAAYALLRNMPAAEDQFEAAALLEPKRVEPRKQLGGVLLDSGKYDDAVAALEMATKLAPTDAQSFELLAKAYRAAGKTSLAQQAAARAKQLRGR